MANTKKTTTPKKPVVAKSVVETKPVIEEVAIVKSEPTNKWEPDLTERIPVKSAVYGKLVYIDPRTKLKYVWSEFGQVEYMELQELKTARNSSPQFFSNRWWEIDDVDVIKWLNVEKFYNGTLSATDLDVLLTQTPAEIERVLGSMSDAQKSNYRLRVKELVDRGDIDSLRTIKALERALSTQFSE